MLLRKEFGCVYGLSLNFQGLRCAVALYDPTEGDDEERERLWNDWDRILVRVDNGHKLGVMGELNGWIGYWVRDDITGAFGVPGENEKERRVLNINAE